MVSDGQYHVAELLAIKKNFTLRVDRGLARSIINEGSKDYLRLSTPMYLGGLPPDPGQQAFTLWHLRNLSSFNGCMREVWINHKQVDFGNAAQQLKVTPGCTLMDTEIEENEDEAADEMDSDLQISEPEAPPPDPCEHHQCRNGGKCVATRGGDYTCRCRPGHRGKYCEQGEIECKYSSY